MFNRRENILDCEAVSPLINLNKVSINDALRLFLQDCTIRNLSVHTVEWYRRKLQTFLSIIDGDNNDIKVPGDIKPSHFKVFIRIYRQGGPNGRRADASVNGVLRAIRSFLNYCYKEGLISENTGGKVKLVKEKQKVVETFSNDQIRKLFKQPNLRTFVGVRDFTMMMLLLDTGIRVKEICGITVYDINWREGLITVDGKGNKQRQVPVQLTTLKQLQTYANIRGEVETLAFFVTLDNTPIKIRQVQDRIKMYGRQAGIKGVRCSPHTFRHTFAKLYIQNGGDIFTLQKILGHTSLEMVRRYVNMFTGEVAAAHRKFSPVENLIK